jgi:hypothetical protein
MAKPGAKPMAKPMAKPGAKLMGRPMGRPVVHTGRAVFPVGRRVVYGETVVLGVPGSRAMFGLYPWQVAQLEAYYGVQAEMLTEAQIMAQIEANNWEQAEINAEMENQMYMNMPGAPVGYGAPAVVGPRVVVGPRPVFFQRRFLNVGYQIWSAICALIVVLIIIAIIFG